VDRPAWDAPEAAVAAAASAQAALPPDTLPLERLAVAAAVAATADELRFETTPESTCAAARGLLPTLVAALPRLTHDHGSGLAAALWSRLAARPASPAELRVLNAALVLLADHELAASALAARVAASVRAHPYAVVSAGLGAIQGPLHGASSLWIEDVFADAERRGGPERSVADRLRRGERTLGFGHPLYPSGDPRAGLLLDLLAEAEAASPRLADVGALRAVAARRALPPPNVDFALGALAHVAGLVRGAGEAIFALARTAGWIAHAIEEYERDELYRLRAVYRGPDPE
jgi:citrate synthase